MPEIWIPNTAPTPRTTYSQLSASAHAALDGPAQMAAAERARVLVAAAESDRRLGELTHARRALAQATSIAGDLGDHEVRALVAFESGTLDRQLGRFDIALREFRLGIALLAEGREGHDGTMARYCWAGLSETLRIVGDLRRADDIAERLRASAHRQGDARAEVWALQSLAQSALQRGAVDDAERSFARSLDLAQVYGDRRGAAWARRGNASVHLDRGRPIAALSEAEQASREFADLGMRVGVGYAQKLAGQAHAQVDDTRAARVALDRSMAEFNATSDRRGCAFARLELAALAVRRGKGLDDPQVQDALDLATRSGVMALARRAHTVVVGEA